VERSSRLACFCALLGFLTLLPACGRHSGVWHSGGGSSSGSMHDARGGKNLGSFSIGYTLRGDEAGSDPTELTFHSDFDPSDYELSILVFQDLNEDHSYSAQTDRLLARSIPATVNGQSLRVPQTRFRYREVDGPVGLSWQLKQGDALVWERVERFD
jgi:hypothetical protein